ncbi:transcription termination factor [Yersinia intermedia]|uniref:transcription termination factor n=1 Tax=Yersinia intermedia TaxID=631 RepID=UPI001CFEF00F|nr:transcription termination factor [Yersinia intermedia]MCB5312123.1 transcription termination factor [Yersinia intermedia]MCB5326131.1 transcription termination factor [Yersinia intermedia]
MSLFICGFLPKKSAIANGAVAMAITVDAKNAKLAAMKSTMLLEGEFPGSSGNFFAPKVCADRVGSPRPPIHDDSSDNALFSTEWMAHNQWNDEEKEFEPLIPVENNNEIDSVKNIFDLPMEARIAYILLYGVEPETIDKHLLSNAYDLVNDDESEPLYRAVIDGLPRLPQVKHMYITTLAQLIDDVQAHTPVFKSWPDVNKFAEKWINSRPDEREHAGEQTNEQGGESPAVAGKQTRAFEHNYAALDVEVACALFPGDYDYWNIPGAICRGAKEKIKNADEAWRRWSTALRIIPTILSVSRDDLFTMIRGAELDIHKDTVKLKAYINECLQLDAAKASDLKVENLGDGKFSVDGLTGVANDSLTNTDTTEKLKTDAKVPKGATEQPNTALNGPNNATNDEMVANSASLDTSRQEEAELPIIELDAFQQRATLVEKEITSKSEEAKENLLIWSQVQRTDPTYTKPLEGAGFAGTSINAEYMFMRATEIFGPIGTGWGYTVLEEKMVPGAPMSEALYDGNKKFIGTQLIRNADGSLITELNHSIKIQFWYLVEGDIRGELESYGATPYMYKTKNGIKADAEVIKKSLTDAIKKALSMLGFSADVYLGMHDDGEYLASNAIEFGIKKASEKAGDSVRLRKELDEKFKANTETMRTAVTANEVNKICSTLTRVMDAHIKNAKAIGDKEYEKYLTGRLRRLNEIKAECLTKFDDSEGKTA